MYTVKRVWTVCLVLLATSASVSTVQAEGFLRTQGQDMVDQTGSKILLQGVGLGNWMLPEGYMWKFGPAGDRPRKIEKLVSDLIGPQAADRFWRQFRQHYITEADIRRIAELGFNSVRPALNARLFLTEGENPEYIEEGFALLDNLVGWCRQSGIYVIIDMHGAPGGQTGSNIDDSANDWPDLFKDKANQDRLVELWVKIAERYQDEPAVAAYDLLNEPLPQRTGAAEAYRDQLEPLYRRITQAIRRVDAKHMITLEGADWANDWSVFTRPFDDNLFYQFHYYCWDRPDKLNDISRFLARRAELNCPVWVGETGEKGNAIYWATTQYFEAHNIGWSFWPWKKMDANNAPYSIKNPQDWDLIRAYSRGRDKPDGETAQKAFDELIHNIRLEHCAYFPDVVNAIFRRAPGRVEAENYGHDGPNQSYVVKDAGQTSEYYRITEPVPVERIDSTGNRWTSRQAIRLVQAEWTTYRIGSLAARPYRAVVRANPQTVPAALTITLNGQAKTLPLAETGWQEIALGEMPFAAGENLLKLTVDRGVILFDWFGFE
ncbi:MAG: cellulase family glycosylhydrolase [Sedimentisphaerales bacterium]|nr:cellulase family glycosylhydrolase [Sedimentisphaerales bacterium]